MAPVTSQASGNIRLKQPSGRWILLAAVLGSSMAMLDATVVNVALPTIGRDLHTSLGGLQWTVTAYTLTLAGLILLGGSLAIIQASFVSDDRPRAIGAWSGLGGVAGAAGPLLGGWLVGAAGWRWIFLINLPLAAVVVLVSLRHVPETRDPSAHGRFDVTGAVLAALALTAITYALIEAPVSGTPQLVITVAVGVAAAVAFVMVERRRGRPGEPTPPMLPLDVFGSRQFTAVNVVTFVVYGAFGGVFFLLVLELQVVSGFSPLQAGLALVPATVLMLLLSARAGALAQRVGPRWLMAGGTLTSAAGLLLLTRIGPDASYLADVLPGIAVFGLGLSATVAPLTATVLASADVRHAGVASGVNNAVARAAGLLAVAGLPLAVGLSGAGLSAADFESGFRKAMVVCAVLLAAGAVLSALTIDNNVLRPEPGRTIPEPECLISCAVGAPPLEPADRPGSAVAGPARH